MAMPDAARFRPWRNSGDRTLETIVRALVFALAIIPCALAAAAPIWVASTLVEVWVAMLNLSELERRAFYGGALATAISIVGLKYVIPLLVALACPNGTGVGFTAPAIWAVAVMASFVIVARGSGSHIPQLDQLDGPAIGAIALLWACVEVIGSLAPAALVALPRQKSPKRGDYTVAKQEPLANDETSAPSGPTADEIFGRLIEAKSNPSGWRYGVVERDGSIRTSHRQLAKAFKIPKSKLERRLDWLKRDGRINVVSTQRDTRILLIGDAADKGSEPASPP
jgi:hypothetical protein